MEVKRFLCSLANCAVFPHCSLIYVQHGHVPHHSSSTKGNSVAHLSFEVGCCRLYVGQVLGYDLLEVLKLGEEDGLNRASTVGTDLVLSKNAL